MTGILSPTEIDFFSYVHSTDDGPDFWFSSCSVVESLFKDEKISLPADITFTGTSTMISTYRTILPESDTEEDENLLFRVPSDILQRILGYISPKDLAHLERVCKRFVLIATENSLWKELYMTRWKLLEITKDELVGYNYVPREEDSEEESTQDEWAWIYSLLQQNERWKDIFKIRHSAEQWRIGTLKMFNGCWGFISQVPDEQLASVFGLDSPALDIFFHRKDICPDGAWYEDWWLQDTPGVSRSQKCGYWDTFLYGRKVRYKQRAAYAQGRRPQACQISFLDQERVSREAIHSDHNGINGYSSVALVNARNMVRADVGSLMNHNPKVRHSHHGGAQKRVVNYVHPSSNFGFVRSRR